MRDPEAGARRAVRRERGKLLQQIEDWLETPMLLLALAWLALLVVELVWGLSPLLERVGTVIWGVFVLDFALKLALAPDRVRYLKGNWLTALALLLPALRVFRAARVLRLLRAGRAARGVRLFRLFTSLNRGTRALRAALGRSGFGYVVALTLAVTLAGAAGMYAFEAEAPGGGFHGYADALWWTAMLMTTSGSEYWPRSAEGRVLCFFLALYAFAVFGYVTATLATFLIGGTRGEAEDRPDAESLAALRAEIAALRDELRAAREPQRTPEDPRLRERRAA
jgi:voltage-gated potassium channel